jgi:large subunit ribosomal protein L7e
MSTENANKLNSNPEILLKKRKNADRLRVEKQQQAKRRAEERLKKQNSKKSSNKFIRAETIVAHKLATDRENERIKRVSKWDKLHFKNEIDNKGDLNDDKNNERLLFVFRISNPHIGDIPIRARKVLNILRLKKVNQGTFVRLNKKVEPLLHLINPYVVVGTPSLSTVRNLIQKRATVKIDIDNEDDKTVEKKEEDEGKKIEGNDYRIIPLNDNNLIEEKLGDFGVICTEDIIFEIFKLGDSFLECVKFLEPFTLKEPVTGWGPLSKLQRLEKKEESKKYQISNKRNAPLNEIDIDSFIQEQI